MMNEEMSRRPITLLIAEDDEDDRMLIEDALAEVGFEVEPLFMADGEEVMEHLALCHAALERGDGAGPDLIMLDLNMPRKGGMDVLREVRAGEMFRAVPVVILTTSRAQHDVMKSYELGANSFITKPASYDQLVETMRALKTYWVETVCLPKR